jgi:ribose transport system permease protein
VERSLPSPARAGYRAAARAVLEWSKRNGLFFALVLLVVIFSLVSPRFLTSANVKVILLQVAVIGIVAVPGAMLILSGYVDLSVGSVAVLVSITFGILAKDVGTGWAFAFGIAIGIAWGAVQGGLISYGTLSPIVVTLGGLAGARGIAEFISKGQIEYGFGSTFAELGNGTLLGLPVPVWLFFVAFPAGGYVWYCMRYGAHMAAIGSDQTVARSLGILVRRIPLVLYTVSGFTAAVGGLIITSQLDGSSLSIGTSLELEVLTAILLGGVAFTGGRGSLFGVLMGVLFTGVLDNGLVVSNVSPFLSNAVIGTALVGAAALDVIYQRLDRVPFRARRAA